MAKAFFGTLPTIGAGHMPKVALTDALCKNHPSPGVGQPQVLLWDSHKGATPGFALRVTTGARSFILDYAVDGIRRRATIGRFPDLSLKAARLQASKLKASIYGGADPVTDKRLKREAAKAEAEAASQIETHTVGALLTAYVASLDGAGKASTARSVRNIFGLHVRDAHPALWATPAADLDPEDAVAILSPLIVAGKRRAAGKARAYMRAAYGAAIRARLDPAGTPALRAFGLRTNPLGEVSAIASGNNARDRALSVTELRAYWQRAQADPLLALHLLTGAQRIEQIARVTLADLDWDARTIRLMDIKGRRAQPRAHVVPLLPEAMAAIEALATPRAGPFVFTATQGRTGAGYSAMLARLAPIVRAMVDAGEAARFTIGDLRRSVETRLAALGVPKETRAQLQSHGLGGIQDRHYDRHGYDLEKRDALEQLHRLLIGTGATVRAIRSKRGAA